MSIPIFNGLVSHVRNNAQSFHVPGHKSGDLYRSMRNEMNDVVNYYEQILNIDVTELSSTDDLHDPVSIIAEGERLAAKCFKAGHTFFLVGGSTAGNLAMIMSTCQRGDMLIVQRNVHKSVIHAISIVGVRAVFITPKVCERTGMGLVPSIESIEAALQQFPEARGVFLSCPNYFGQTTDLRNYTTLIHQYGKLVLVDEAHGAHFGHHQRFPRSAVQLGADMVVQSTHKTLAAMTMGAMLHVNVAKIDREMVRTVLSMIQSSSPSFPILASLDIARAMIDYSGSRLFDSGIKAADEIVAFCNDGTLLCIQTDDPLRVLFSDCSGRVSGYELLKLFSEHEIWLEMANDKYALAIFGMYVSRSQVERMKAVIEAVERKILIYRQSSAGIDIVVDEVNLELVAVEIPMWVKEKKVVSVDDAIGCRSAETLIPYPPGIPLVYRGEMITTQQVQKMRNILDKQGQIQGLSDKNLATMVVIRE